MYFFVEEVLAVGQAVPFPLPCDGVSQSGQSRRPGSVCGWLPRGRGARRRSDRWSPRPLGCLPSAAFEPVIETCSFQSTVFITELDSDTFLSLSALKIYIN